MATVHRAPSTRLRTARTSTVHAGEDGAEASRPPHAPAHLDGAALRKLPGRGLSTVTRG